MTGFTKFRSSMGGFNRADVTEYIAALCNEHHAALRKSESAQAALEEQLNELRQQLQEQTECNRKLQEEYTQLQEQEEYKTLVIEEQAEVCEDWKARYAALEEKLAAAESALAELTPTEADEAQSEPLPDYRELELEAYRRAEATERLAAERAGKMQLQLCDLLDNVSDRYGETGNEIQALTDDIRTNLKRLEDALSDLEVIFDETTESFRRMDPMEPVTAE